MTMTLARDRAIDANGLRFHYRAWGDPASPPLFILHGITGHAWEFDRMAERLAGHFHVLAIDQRGHGASDWAPTYAPAAMAGDIAALVEALGVAPVAVVGHSMGAINTYLAAARFPRLFARLVLLDAGPGTLTGDWAVAHIPAMLAAAAAARYDDSEDAVVDYVGGGDASDELRRFVLNDLRRLPDGRWTWRFDAAGLATFQRHAPSAAEQWAALRQVPCPTLVVRAAASAATTPAEAARMVRELPRGRLVEIPDAGHDIHLDQFELLMGELERFLISPS